MKLLFTSDLHGSSHHYAALVDLVRSRRCDTLVLGGDMLPDGDRGRPYQAVTDYIRNTFRQFLEQARQAQPKLTILKILGNHDWLFTLDELLKLQQAGLLRVLDHRHYVKLGGLAFLGLSYAPPAPYWIKDYERRDMTDDPPSDFCGYYWSTEKKWIMPVLGSDFFSQHESLEQILAEAPTYSEPWVFVSHAPPDNGLLDLLPGGLHVGSRAVRRFIEARRPLLALHGHIHESPGQTGHCTERVGQTLCVNPGQEHGRLCAVWWDSDNPDVVEHNLGIAM
ncbi:MAG: metallophosphoesterase [Sedimentisphaerales bacterium]|nr:metallophosphoesterase [Sedimentisphaerales bacterium]